MTSKERYSNTMQLCRVCAENRPEMLPIFSELDDGTIIASVITESTAVQILEDDRLPQWICDECAGEVRLVSSFMCKTRQSDDFLRNLIKQEIKEEEQLYALEISVLGQSEEMDFADDLMDENVIEVDDEQEETEELESKVEFNAENENHDLPVDKSDSAEEYQPKRAKAMKVEIEEVELVDGNESDYLPEDQSDSDEEYQPRSTRRRANKKDISIPESSATEWIDDLDELEKKTFEIVDVGDKWVCCTCFKLFDSENVLKAHGRNVHGANQSAKASKKHACSFCCKRYASLITLKAHYRHAKAITKVFDCRLCPARFASTPKRRIHAHKHPPPVPESSIIIAPIPIEVLNESGKLCCAQGCTAVFDSEEELLAHSVATHYANKVQSALTTKDRPIECQVCYRRFMDEKGLKTHQQRVYMPKKHVCSICGMKFAHPGDCKRHERDHENVDNQLKCDECPKSFVNVELLKAHKKRHSATREFTCTICGQSYLQKQNLMGHMLMHEGKWPFECEICGKGFRMKAKLMYHQRVHSGERPYPCRYCNIAFADSTNRLRHEMSHTGIKPYKCDYCEKTFITKRLKKEHENTHAGNSRYRRSAGKTKTESL